MRFNKVLSIALFLTLLITTACKSDFDVYSISNESSEDIYYLLMKFETGTIPDDLSNKYFSYRMHRIFPHEKTEVARYADDSNFYLHAVFFSRETVLNHTYQEVLAGHMYEEYRIYTYQELKANKFRIVYDGDSTTD